MKNRLIETQQKLPEDEEDRETQREVKEGVKKWGRTAFYLGLALILSVGLCFLFLPGQALHSLWQTWGRAVAIVSLCIFFPWLYAAATTLNLWLYGANLRKIDRDFASGKSSERGR